MNELLLIASVIFIFGAIVLAYFLFGKAGLFAAGAIASVLANIEVSMLIVGFGIEQTLGNVLFAGTFLVTDILSECESRRDAQLAVWIGVFASAFFLVLNQAWLLFEPSPNDQVMQGIQIVFSRTPRILIASLVVYVISQFFDVWLYHKWWAFSEKRAGNRRALLWLRNCGSTLISQLVNTVLFTLLAFAGTYEATTIVSLIVSTYVIYVATSLLDTPLAYLARRMKDAGKVGLLARPRAKAEK